MEVKVPFCFSGIPLPNVNNPILILVYKTKIKKVNRKPKLKQFLEYLRDATGFYCDASVDIEGNLPFSSYYILFSEIFLTEAIKVCELPITKREMEETLKMIDDAIYDSPLIRGLRMARNLDSSILYRDGEEPVILNFSVEKVNVLEFFPISSPRYVDNSVIHLTGILPIKILNDVNNLLSVENGLWSSLYNLPYPTVPRWKWIWDLNWATLIEFSN